MLFSPLVDVLIFWFTVRVLVGKFVYLIYDIDRYLFFISGNVLWWRNCHIQHDQQLLRPIWPALGKGIYVTSIYSLCSYNIESFFFPCVTLFIKIFNVKLIWGSQFVVVITTKKKWNSVVSSQTQRKRDLCVYWTFCVCQFWTTK